MVSLFHFYPSPSLSPLSSSLFHSFSFLLSQCNVIQDWCWQPQLWHCNLCSAVVARQPVWDRDWWCTSLSVCFQKKKWRGRVSGLASQLSAKIQMIPLNFSFFRMGSFTSAVQQKTLCMWCIREAKFYTKNTRPNPQDGGRCSLWCCPPSNVCDGKCCVQILCHHA